MPRIVNRLLAAKPPIMLGDDIATLADDDANSIGAVSADADMRTAPEANVFRCRHWWSVQEVLSRRLQVM